MDSQTTAYLFTLLGMLLNTAAMGVVWYMVRPMPGAGAWFLGSALVFVAFVPLLIFKITPWLPLVSLHNVMAMGGQAIVVGGIFAYFGKPPPWRLLLGLVAIYMALHSWYLYGDYDVARRTMLASLLLAVVSGIGAWPLSRMPWTGARAGRLFAVVAWWALVLTLVLRGGMAGFGIATHSDATPGFEANLAYLLVFIVSPVTMTGAALGLIMMTVHRLADERETALAETRRAASHFEQMASYDMLTGAYSRRMFFARAAETLSQCRRQRLACSLLLLDLDFFKKVNDSHGHAGGDEALRYLARTIRAVLRDFDFFGRLGGEEFAVMLSSVDAARAAEIGNRLREAVAAGTVCHAGHEFRITMSGGVVTAEATDSVDSLLAAADAALYRAKHNGRNRIELAGVPAAG